LNRKGTNRRYKDIEMLARDSFSKAIIWRLFREFTSIPFEFLLAFNTAEIIFFSVVSDFIFCCLFV
jgi:hypothetical protein